jgi:pyruvate dehydrogenase E1 component
VLANTVPNCRTYDPTYAYELAVVVQDGLRRMYGEKENCYYYITLMNENYTHPEMPEGVEDGIIKGMYKLKAAENEKAKLRANLLGSGTILREVEVAAEILRSEFKVESDVWSVTSVNELTRDGQAAERWNMLHPEAEPQQPYITGLLAANAEHPTIIATDYLKTYSEQLRPYIEGDYKVLGTEGFGRSDSRQQLRHFFEVNSKFIVVATLKALADQGKIKSVVVTKAIEDFGIDPDKANPMTV